MRVGTLIGTGLLWGAMMSVSFAIDKEEFLQHPDRHRALAEIQGEVQLVDMEERQLTLKDASNRVVTVRIEPDTRALDYENHALKWNVIQPGDRIILYYNTRELSAVQVDVLPKPSELFLGTGISGVGRGRSF